MQRAALRPGWKHDPLWGPLCAAQPHGLSPAANVVKECGEEAGIPPDLAAQALPVGAVCYEALQPAGVKRDVLFCYDLRLPENFVPAPQARHPLASGHELQALVAGSGWPSFRISAPFPSLVATTCFPGILTALCIDRSTCGSHGSRAWRDVRRPCYVACGMHES